MATQNRQARARAAKRWAPPKRRHLSDWADRHFYLSPESSAEAGPWKTLPYQRGIMDAITDPSIERIYFMKSARVGATKIMNAAIGYYMVEDPCPIQMVQPTIEDAQGYSEEELKPMLRDVVPLREVIPETSDQKILHKRFPGGSFTMVGANSARGFRRVSRKVMIFDEVDGYPPTAGAEGDQIKLGIKRTEYYWDRKIIAASTPLIAGRSRIESLFEEGDQRRYHVPCPHCDHMDYFVFRQEGERGHFMRWPKDKPKEAHFVCRQCGGTIDERHKRSMIERGRWIPGADFNGVASFHVWAAYSYSPNASWAQLAGEFLSALKKPEELKTFVNTALGETWKESGDAPEWRVLYNRREQRAPGELPEGPVFLTAGVDVQRDRFVWEVIGWGRNKESWSVDAGLIMGDTSLEKTWGGLDELLMRDWGGMPIRMLAIDSGFNTNQTYTWARRYPMSRVIAVKGRAQTDVLIGKPSRVDVTIRGRKLGYRVWIVGVNIAKTELYGWLRLESPPSGEHYPAGFCHFPEYGEDYFQQVTSEQLVTSTDRRGYTKIEWQLIPGRENHFLDTRVYARAAAALLGLDRMKIAAPKPAAPAVPVVEGAPQAVSSTGKPKRPRREGGWLSRR